MRVYIKATEILPEGETADNVNLDVTENTEAEVTEIIGLVKDLMPGSPVIKHFCRHDEHGACDEKIV